MVRIGPRRDLVRDADKGGSPPAATSGSVAIAAQLRRAILDGAYDYGDRLPAERDLAEHFRASRSTVREALRQLEEMRLVSRRIGSGTFVVHNPGFSESTIVEMTSPLELVEVRIAFEPHMVRLAVLNATARELDQLAEALERLEDCGGDREEFSREDEGFHLALAECTRNPMMVWLYRQINNVRGHRQWAAMKETILSPQRIAEYNRQHRDLYEALKSRDIDGAVQIITSHLDKARRDLLGAEREQRGEAR